MMNAMANSLKLPGFHGELHAVIFALSRSRFSVLLLIAGLVLLLSDQGQDVLTAYAEDGKTLRVAVAAAFWALSIWGWSRLLLDVHYDDLPSCKSCYRRYRKWIPRLLGSFAFLVLAFSAYQTEQGELVWWALGGLVVFLVYVVWRRPVMRALAALLGRSRFNAIKAAAPWLDAPEMAAEPPYTNLREMLGMPGRDARAAGEHLRPRVLIALAMLLGFVALAALGNLAPVWLGSRTGALILFFLWSATWLPLGSWMSYVADKHGYPLITMFVIAALVSSYYNDNHEIRHATAGQDVGTRPTVTEGLNAWARVNKPAGSSATPFVVVATAGGGIRAAYWTATVLGHVQDNATKFSLRTFAISGVSGGAVGATVYRALLDVPPDQRSKACGNVTECAQLILANDFLGPLSAALLYPDLAQRFWPAPVLPDRAAALEQGWEQAFKKASGQDSLNSSLVALNNGSLGPSLFLNATWSDNGRRIVASNLRYDRKDRDEAESFGLANDELTVLGYDLRLSTAAHNSARFPYVSPPGMWRHKGEIAGRLQDGGLFENYGAETAMEIIDLACRKFACPDADSQKKQRPKIVPVVILISSDPTLPPNLADSPQDLAPVNFGYEFRSTFRTYERVRGGRGAEAAAQLQKWIEQDHGGKFFPFRMCESDHRIGQPPLGWSLSDSATKTIKSYLPGGVNDQSERPACAKDNLRQYEELKKFLTEQ